MGWLNLPRDPRLLECVSMNNQECKVRPEIVDVVDVNSKELVFYPFSINPKKVGFFEGSFSWGRVVKFDPPPSSLHISRRTYPASTKLHTIVKQSF